MSVSTGVYVASGVGLAIGIAAIVAALYGGLPDEAPQGQGLGSPGFPELRLPREGGAPGIAPVWTDPGIKVWDASDGKDSWRNNRIGRIHDRSCFD
jgi:hypothetical protein